MHKLLLILRKGWIVIVLMLLSYVFYYFDLTHLIFNLLKQYEPTLATWTVTHYFSAVFLYLSLFVVLIACGIPCATLLTIIGGFLFGTSAILYSVFSLTIGGMLLFLLVRFTLGHYLSSSTSRFVHQFEHGFQQNAFRYLLFLRLMPVFPCSISNVSAGALNVPLKTFLAATILGVLPTSIIYAWVGRDLDRLLALQALPSYQLLLAPNFLVPFIGVMIFCLLPLLHKALKNRIKSA